MNTPVSILTVASIFAAIVPVRAGGLTPAPLTGPRINGPSVFGVRPGSPFLYTIPATGERPLHYSAEGLPAGLALDALTGQITGVVAVQGTSKVRLHATNRAGSAEREFRIVAGSAIGLTPPMGWNSWNCWGASVDADKVLRSARALVASGLARHGWSYINIDDTWQGQRTGEAHALQANAKFPQMKQLCDQIHEMGLKVGLYSTPWITSYTRFGGGSSDRPDGYWDQSLANGSGHRLGKFSFAEADARQFAVWGIDYLKYDWKPIDLPHVREMSQAIRNTGRDIFFSLSNSAPFDHASELSELANSWRTTSDIWDRWVMNEDSWQYGVSEIGFNQDRWTRYAGPGHWNDPDMLVVGYVTLGGPQHHTNLTEDEQYSHISLWCLLSAPLLIGCDLEKLDSFTIGLLSNDEVIAVDQDPAGAQATRVATSGSVDVYLKHLEDGSKVLGFFNRDQSAQSVSFNKLSYIGFSGRYTVRDLWRQQDCPIVSDAAKDVLKMTIAGHGVQLYRFIAAQKEL